MQRTITALVASSLLVAPAMAVAEVPRADADLAASVPTTLGWIGAEPRPDGGLRTVLQVIPDVPQPASLTGALAADGPRWIIYMNRVGGTYSPGNNDARTNRSSLVQRATRIDPWAVSNANWNQVMTCVKDLFAPFDVEITDVDPGPDVPHIESVVAGSPGDLGQRDDVGGVSPFTSSCTVIPNSIVFTFANVFGNDMETVCEVVAQEAAHSFGLDHELLASDPMTYLGFSGLRRFQDVEADCGERTVRPCGLPGGQVCRQKQNSVRLLLERIGPAQGSTPTEPGMVTITSPPSGATVPPGFTVDASLAPNVTATRVELWIDGALSATKTAAPYRFTTSEALPEGQHTIEVRGYGAADEGLSSVNVTVRNGAPEPSPSNPIDQPDDPTGGSADGDTVTGGCDAGSGAPGVLVALGIYGLLRRRGRRPH